MTDGRFGGVKLFAIVSTFAIAFVACYHHGHLPPPSAKLVGGADADATWLSGFSAGLRDVQPQLEPCKSDDCVCTALCNVKAPPSPKGLTEVNFSGHPGRLGVQVDEKGKVVKCFFDNTEGDSEIDDCPWVTH